MQCGVWGGGGEELYPPFQQPPMVPNSNKSFRESPHLVSQKPGDLKGIFPQNVKFPLLRTICLEEETVPQDDVVPLWGPNSFWNHFFNKI